MLPDDPLVDEVLIPCFQTARSVDSMVGFFSSQALGALAPGLATFISGSDEPIRLLICPILSEADRDAIHDGVMPCDDAAKAAISQTLITEDLIARHTLRCLTWLLRADRLEIRVALMKAAIFHPKVWLFHNEGDVLAIHGSSNMTYSGIQRNIEQVAVSRSWADPNQQYTTQRLRDQFAALWDGTDENCITVAIPNALREQLVRTYRSTTVPQETELQSLYERARSAFGNAPVSTRAAGSKRFKIPADLEYDHGPFAHQGKAVTAWCDAGNNGVLEMATGSGKTIAALIAAHRLHEDRKPLLIVVAAPYVPLIQQWCDEATPFGLNAINITEAKGPRGRAHELGKIRRRLRSRASDVELVVVSHATLSSRDFRDDIGRVGCVSLLIADEVHNLGSEGFISDPPTCFDYTLGLSATPVRQYDAQGTEALLDFCGPVVFRFPLKDAIGTCLVEYDYYVHVVELTSDEMDRWYDLTDRIRANAWRAEEGSGPDNYLTRLLRDRRAILESAANKIAALERLIDAEDPASLRHTLIYTSDKAPGQLEAVNELLTERGVLFHQLTYVETANRDFTRRIIGSFQEGPPQGAHSEAGVGRGGKHSADL